MDFSCSDHQTWKLDHSRMLVRHWTIPPSIMLFILFFLSSNKMFFEELHSRFENEDNALTSSLITCLSPLIGQLHRTTRKHEAFSDNLSHPSLGPTVISIDSGRSRCRIWWRIPPFSGISNWLDSQNWDISRSLLNITPTERIYIRRISLNNFRTKVTLTKMLSHFKSLWIMGGLWLWR